MSISASVRRRLIERQGGQCAGGCGRDLKALLAAPLLRKYLPRGRSPVEVDHVVPQAQGGDDEPSNLQALCGWCHDDKTTAEREDWQSPARTAFVDRGIRPEPVHSAARRARRHPDKTTRRAVKGPRKGLWS